MSNPNECMENSLGGHLYSDGIMQTRSLQLRNLGRHRSGEEVGMSLLWYHFQDLVKDRSKIEIQQSIGFIHNLRKGRPSGML